VHLGLDHGKMEELMPKYTSADPTEQLVNCRRCDYTADQAELKAHLAATHYRQSLLALCLKEGALQPGVLVCTFCSAALQPQELLMAHLGF
jgi:hypothetical protein